MFPNLQAELARSGLTYEDIAKKIGLVTECEDYQQCQ